MNDPSPTFLATSQSAPIQANQGPTPHSMRSRRTATWARPRNSDDGYSRYTLLHLTTICHDIISVLALGNHLKEVLIEFFHSLAVIQS